MANFSSSSDSGTEDNTTPWTNVAPWTEYPEFKAGLIIWKIWPPFIFLVGGFGNIATILVMRRLKDHNSSQNAILMVLAISDFVLLCTGVVKHWVWVVFRVDVSDFHVVVCKVLLLIIYVSSTMSAWLVTCVTVQRTMAVLWPHKMRVMWTVRRTWIVIVSLVLGACVLDFHVLVGMVLDEKHTCEEMPGAYQIFFELIFSWVDSFLASIIPSVCLFVCDIILSVSLFRAVMSASSASTNTDSRRKISFRTTIMVLTISCAFLALTTPVRGYLIWIPYVVKDFGHHPRMAAMSVLFHALSFQLWYTNSAINFFLYCLTGTKFRREFMNLIHCRAQSTSVPTVQETTSKASKGGRHKDHGDRPLSK